MTNVYGVVRCARKVRRRRATRMLWMIRVLRLLLWSALAGAVMCLLSGCGVQWQETGTMSGLPKWVAGSVLGLSTFLIIGLVWMAVIEQGRQDRKAEPYKTWDNGGFVDPLEAPVPGLDAEDLRRVLRACEVEARRVRELMASAERTLSVEDYGDALRAGQDAQSMIIGCLQGLRERLGETANAEPLSREASEARGGVS